MKYTATLNGKQYEVELERIDAYEPMPRYGEAPAVAPAPEQRNYNMTKDKKTHPDRMETKKYCKFCKSHTLHKETK